MTCKRVSTPFVLPESCPLRRFTAELSPMKWQRRSLYSKLSFAFGLTSVCAIAWAQVTSPALLELDVENIVSYSSDVFDASRFATDSNLTTAAAARNFGFVLAVGDIVAVNRKTAKGSMVARQQAIRLSPNPSSGQGVADTVRTAVTEFLFDIQQADGTPVGNLHTLTLSGGVAPAGLSSGGRR